MQKSDSVLLPVNKVHGYESALHLAHSFTHESKGKIYAIYVIEVKLDFPIDVEVKDEINRGEETLAYIELLAKEEKCTVEAEILQARQAGPAIVQEAANIMASMIVLSVDHNNVLTGFRMGKTTDYVLKNSRCPVLLWRSGAVENPLPPGGLV